MKGIKALFWLGIVLLLAHPAWGGALLVLASVGILVLKKGGVGRAD
ncbi:hypothetical protein [Holophaga foetida]|nr:hypothetical protein [Holophaga foetida]